MSESAGRWVVIGVPSSAGAHHAGQDRAPAALRAAGLIEALRAAGESVRDAGDLPGAVFQADHEHPRARNLAAVVRVAREVADAVAAVDEGELPLVIGGDCTITLGVIAGFRRRHPDVGLVYVDGDADLGTGTDTGSGILDSAGVAHLLGQGVPELAGLAARRRCSSRPGWPCWAATRERPTTRGGSSWPGWASASRRARRWSPTRRARPGARWTRSRRPAARPWCTSTWTSSTRATCR